MGKTLSVSSSSDGATATEATSLLNYDRPQSVWFGPIRRVYLTSFLIALAFAFTQTSIIYAFRVMTCDGYYQTHEWEGLGDRCAIPIVEAETAVNVAIMGSSTTFFTIINVFFVGWLVKRYGVKTAMFQQTGWAALRNLTQIYALTVGGSKGVMIIQITQAFNILGSGGGYQLAGNGYIAALADPEDRTATFGVLGGFSMLGNALGFVAGGLAYRYVGSLTPFYSAFVLLCLATVFGALFLPYIAPDSPYDDPKKSRQGVFAPLKIFVPYKRMDGGKQRWDFNLFLLGAGAFFAVFATGYVPLGLQLIGTNVFGFQPLESGYMISFTLLVKAFFLSILFPRIISSGRRFVSRRPDVPTSAAAEHPEDPREAEEPTLVGTTQQTPARQPTDRKHGSTFDLHFLQWSIFLDGVLTSFVSLSTKGLHLYIAAGVIPFASGTGASVKGVVLDFCEPSLRSDALSAISLVEKIAFISTAGGFGYIFSLLSQAKKPMLIFLINGAVALFAFVLLMPVRMPRPGQALLS